MRYENSAQAQHDAQALAGLAVLHFAGVALSIAAPVPFALVYVPWLIHRTRLARRRRTVPRP